MQRALALRYMTRFACIGSACEETCCGGGWSIAVDEPHHRALTKAMSGTPEERAELAAALEPAASTEAKKKAPFRLKLVDDGSCTFLQPDRLCSIYRRYGDDAVPNACAIFPRHVSVIGDRVELAGTLACPEAARLALLADDAFNLDVFDPSTLPRQCATIELALGGAYESCFDYVRFTALEIMGRRDLPLGVRLFLCAYFGERTKGFFHRGATALDADRLAKEIALVLNPAVGEKWRGVLGAVRTQGPRAGQVLIHALRERLAASSRVSSLPELLRTVVANLVAAGAGVLQEGSETYDLDPGKLLAVHARRRDGWETSHGPVIERALTNLARQFWMKEPYLQSPDLLVHAQKLILRMALVRFLLFSHPLLVDAPADPDTAVERAVVDVVQKLARTMEHDSGFAAALDQLLADLQLETLAQAVFLLAV